MKLPRGAARDLLLPALGMALFGVLYTPVGDVLSEPLRMVAYRGALSFIECIGEAHRAAPAKYIISSLSSAAASITITPSCSGLRAVALWAAFVAFVPIPWKKRLLHFLLGTALLLTINIVRLGHLFVLMAHHPADFHIYHEWIWPLAKVAIIVIYWAILILVSGDRHARSPRSSAPPKSAPESGPGPRGTASLEGPCL